jgi:hypothetical protein
MATFYKILIMPLLHRGFGRCTGDLKQPCNRPRRSDDAPFPISEGAGVGFGEGLKLDFWTIIDHVIHGTMINNEPTVSWLFVPPSPKLLAPVPALTAEVPPSSICIKLSFQVEHIILL